MRFSSIVDAVGRTPMVELTRLTLPGGARIYAKLERFNPGGSVKFRAAIAMVKDAMRSGKLRNGGTIVESSSGNLAVALAIIGAALELRVIVVIDPKTTATNQVMLRAFGAEVVMVEEPDPVGGYQVTRLNRAREIVSETPGGVLLHQYANPANSVAHRATAHEILTDLGQWPDCIVTAVSSAGQIAGVGRVVKQASPKTLVVAADAVGSAVFGGTWHAHLVRGTGLSWVPGNFDPTVVDEAYQVSDEVAFGAARLMARHEGILAGGSSGLVLAAALRMSAQLGPDRKVIAMLADGGEKYLDEFYDDEWLAERKVNLRGWDISKLHQGALALRPCPLRAFEEVGS